MIAGVRRSRPFTIKLKYNVLLLVITTSPHIKTSEGDADVYKLIHLFYPTMNSWETNASPYRNESPPHWNSGDSRGSVKF